MTKGWLVIRSQRVPISFRLDQRVPLVLLALGMITLAVMVISVGYGEYRIPPLEVLKTILGFETENSNDAFVVSTLRLPRVLVAFLVGVGLAISGTILQGLTRNSLADPTIIGVSSGASLAAVTLIVLLPTAPLFLLPLAAFGGALTVAILIYLLAWEQGSSSIRLILIGVGLEKIVEALTTLMVTFGQIDSVSQALVWLTGSVYGRSWEHIWPLLPWLVILVPLTLLLSRDLNTLNLGDEVARSLGSQVEFKRGLLLLISVALAGAAVATAGTIGFVGLMAPHIARRLVSPAHEGLIPAAALTGGLTIVLADLLGRSLFAPVEIPCGVITAAIGAPFFLYLMYQSRNL